jgi:hypothetical protein
MLRIDLSARVLLSSLVLTMPACGPHGHESAAPVKAARPPALVKTAVVGREDFALPLRVIGTVTADESSDISANVTETVA